MENSSQDVSAPRASIIFVFIGIVGAAVMGWLAYQGAVEHSPANVGRIAYVAPTTPAAAADPATTP